MHRRIGSLLAVWALVVAMAAGVPPVTDASAAPRGAQDAPTMGAGTPADRLPREAVAELREVADREGAVRALVDLSVVAELEEERSADDVAAQRRAIAAAGRGLRKDLAGTGIEVVRTYTTVPAALVEVPEGAVDALAGSPRVSSVARDETLELSLSDSTELIEANLLWPLDLLGTGHSVAVLDTGVDRDHPFFGDRIIAEACFSSDTSTSRSLCPDGENTQFGEGAAAPCDLKDCFHGTHVAGIAAGGGLTRSGVAPGVGIVAVQVFQEVDSAGCRGCLQASGGDLLAAMDWLAQHREEFSLAAVNLSLGSGDHDAPCDNTWMARAIDDLRAASVATVVATGNAGYTAGIGSPACASSAVSVGASTKDGEVAEFSNTHPDLLDVLAPGSKISSSVPGGGFGKVSGTSMAAPHVAGAWAQLQEATTGTTSVEDILEALTATGRSIVDDRDPVATDPPAYPEVRLDAARRSLLAQFDEPTAGTVRGTVTSAGDVGPVAEATVSVSDDVTVVETASTGSDGAFEVEVEAGIYEVAVLADGFEDAVIDVEVVAGGTVTEDVVLDPLPPPEPQPGTLQGIVVDADDKTPLEGAEVSLGEAVTSTSSDGAFSFPEVEAGTHTVSASAEGYEHQATTVDVGEAETASIEIALIPEPPTQTFSDVSLDHQFFHEIDWMADTGISGGYPDGTFRPSAGVSRQAMAAFLFRVAGEPAGPFPDPGFADVPVDHRFFEEIAWMADAGVSGGYPDGTFRPSADVSRQAMAAFLYNRAG